MLYVDTGLTDLAAATYEALADPRWKCEVCLRSGQHPDNTALISAFLVRHGAEKTEARLRSVKDNLAREATGGDRDVARDIGADRRAEPTRMVPSPPCSS